MIRCSTVLDLCWSVYAGSGLRCLGVLINFAHSVSQQMYTLNRSLYIVTAVQEG